MRRRLRSLTSPESMQDYGSRQLLSGLREGKPSASGLGTALLVLAWVRKHQPPRKELLYGATLRPGETIKIRLVEDDVVVDEAEVTG